MKKTLFALWGGMFIVCAGLGFMPEVTWLTKLAAIAFFLIPGGILLLARRTGDRQTVRLVRNLAACSLALTLGALVGNLLCAPGSENLGKILHWLLGVVSTPMYAAGNWAASLFTWACLLIGSRELDRKTP